MVKRSVLIETIDDDFKGRLPGFHKSRREGLSMLAGVMLDVRCANLMELAAARYPRYSLEELYRSLFSGHVGTADIVVREKVPRYRSVYFSTVNVFRKMAEEPPQTRFFHHKVMKTYTEW